MAKKAKGGNDLFDRARAGGLRKRVAKTISDGAGQASKKSAKSRDAALKNLRELVDELEDHAKGGPRKRKAAAQKAAATRKSNERSAAAQKAARTRKRNAAKRSTAAKQGAKARAKS